MIETQLKEFLKKYPTDVIYVGFSGGIDSVVLLHALNQLKTSLKFTLKAIHINHKLQAAAEDWAVFCETFSHQLDIECINITLTDSPEKGESIEAWARQKRYDRFQRLLQNETNPHLYLAHHQNDQVETFLLNLMRGSGIAGLSAMPIIRKTSTYMLLRPLLDIPRSSIHAYAHLHQLSYIDDPSNQNTRFDRNFMRHEIVSRLSQRFNALSNISQSVNYCQETANLLEQYLENDLSLILKDNQHINLSSLLKLDKIKQLYLIRLWIKKSCITPPNRKQMNQFINSVKHAKNNWQFIFSKYIIIYYNELLQLYKNTPEIPSNFHLPWTGEPIEIMEYNFSITKADLQALGINTNRLNWQKVIIRARKPNDACRPFGRDKSNKLKVIFQEKQIPQWIRARTPIIEYEGKILAIGKLLGCCL
ncbi:tRNA lysidine(34) synthetase TilS [Thiotrichales bacterium 19S3-7]|nr:tRNA lysidine(34) synthetase TilS [Thiotrichales bacterium 19S3-7]MCF6802096.1 tRNA lysidine(34) synthetase TilS [Thiotrichales bacterium 19S3-11]